MSTVESDCFTIGSIVATKTCYNEEIEGEVLAFDPQTKMLILKCPSSSGNPKRHDVNIVNLSLVSDVQIKKEVTSTPDPPQSLNLNRLNTRVRNSIEHKRRVVSESLFYSYLSDSTKSERKRWWNNQVTINTTFPCNWGISKKNTTKYSHCLALEFICKLS